MSRVLLTGADGFTGRYLAATLHEAGHEVHGLMRELPARPVAGLTCAHVCDLLDAPGMAELVRRVEPERVAHLAAVAFVAHGDAETMYRTNLLGTRHLLEALVALPSPPKAALMASSANIYGNSSAGMIDESTSPAPANDYAVSKMAMEYLVQLYAARLPLIVTRPFNYTGVGQAENFLLPKIVAHARRRANVIELGNLDVARDFSDVRTVVEAYGRLLDSPAAIGQTFNVCSGRAYTLHDILNMVRTASGLDMEVHVNPAFVRANEVRTLLGSRARLEAVVGVLPSIAMEETLKWMLEAP